MDADSSGDTSARLRHIPALDGMRGLAVALVLLFHGGVAQARGGYLGVTMFFTLSGFLISRCCWSSTPAVAGSPFAASGLAGPVASCRPCCSPSRWSHSSYV